MPPSQALRPASSTLLIWGVLLVALTMRAPLLAVAPIIHNLQSDLHIGTATAGLLTTIPVLCFGFGAPLVLPVVRRWGLENAVLIELAGTLIGILLRSLDGLAMALLGTLIIGLSITIGNVVVPVIIGRDFPSRSTAVTAAYTSSLNVGSMFATTLSAPLAGRVGWRGSLASWGLLAVLAAVLWRPATSARRAERSSARTRPPSPRAASVQPPAHPRRRHTRLVAGMTLAFAAQSFSYYGISAWLPSLLAADLGLSAAAAGASSSIFQVVAIAGAFVVPGLAARGLSARFTMLVVCAAWITLPLGLALAPSLWPVWCAFGGAAQGGGFTVIFSVIVARAEDERASRRMVATIQGLGYSLGASGPFVVGFIHARIGGWSVPMLLVAGVIVLMAASGSYAIGDRR